ncbi:Glucose dehydrogenase, PQQ-dependent (plasmid) [Candidatus Enterovibrio escicola]|uniref:Glucose dehydrogenase, PQQ-dependent n=1 Tax=Candidatus Enterovibrio escicola TaxID=1927127 RepID=A0A2A5T1P5_9GAMM|nr:Glucose dehydrogenase, PQQ-dependent [Candidatus Enterovibrio escacola]
MIIIATVDVKCYFYPQTKTVKNYGLGLGGHQLYRYQAYCRTFQLEYTYRDYQAGIKEQVIKRAMNN